MADEICHVEIAAKDMAAARDLYLDVFGWEFPLFSEQHALFRAGEGVGGGIWPVTDGLWSKK